MTIKFLNMVTGKEYEESLEKVKFSGITWTHDNKVSKQSKMFDKSVHNRHIQGVFYGCYPGHDAEHATGKDTTSHGDQKLYYHRYAVPS